MTTFTIVSDNNITAFGTAEEATAATATPLDRFSVPDVRYLEARQQFEGFRPIGAGAANRRIVVALSPVLHIVGFHRSAASFRIGSFAG